MALAIVRLEDLDDRVARLRVELGSNRYFAYAIGGGEVDRGRGFAVLRDPAYVSPLLGPLPEEAMGRTRLEVPVERFDRERRHLQVMSFRTADRAGPAVSEVLQIPIVRRRSEELPELTFSLQASMERHMAPAESIPFAYREVRPMSSALFLQGLIAALPAILPTVGGLVGNLLGAAGGGGGGGAGARGTAPASAPTAVLQAIGQPENVRLLQQLIEQITRLAAGGAPAAQSAAARSLATGTGYSRASVAPAVLAALPALMPLLQQVLNPETIQSLISTLAPDRVIGAVTGGLRDLAQVGTQIERQQQEHLRALNPGVDDPALHQLLAGLSLSLAAEPTYRRVRQVELTFAEHVTHPVNGRPRVCYRHGDGIAFPLELATPRPIPRATLHLRVKDPATLRVLAERSIPLSRLAAGRLPDPPRLEAARLRQLRAGEEYLVCATLLWNNRRGERLGTSRSQLVTLVGELTLHDVESEGEVIALNDVAKFRDFWHKVWQGSLSRATKEYLFDAKYYYVLEGERNSNGRMDTVSSLAREGLKKQKGRLKSGLALSPFALNALLPRISDAPPLGEAELAALSTREFAERFHQAARHRVALDGRDGDSVALWVFPSVRLNRVSLKQVARTDPHGQVLEFSERTLRFPFPVLAHFVGTRSTR